MDTASLATLESLLQRVQRNRQQARSKNVVATALSESESKAADPMPESTPTLHGLPVMPLPEQLPPSFRESPAKKELVAGTQLEPRPASRIESAKPSAVSNTGAAGGATPSGPVTTNAAAPEKRAFVSETPTLTGAPTFAAEAAPPVRRTFAALLAGSLGLRLKK